MSEDLIRRSDAIEVIEPYFDYIDTIPFYEAKPYVREAVYGIRNLIKFIPTIEPKRGEWIEDYNNTYGRCRMKCSVCGKFSGIGGIKSNQRKPFCPNCGADMRGADDDIDDV